MLFFVYKFILVLMLTVFAAICFLHVAAVPSVEVTLSSPESTSPLTWLAGNWEKVALVISEVAALVSVKYSGFIKSAVSIFSSFFSSKKN
jgi:hypothetical protein